MMLLRLKSAIILLAVPLLMVFSIGSVQADEGRTIVTDVTTFDTSRVTNALLFSKHTCQFHPEAEDSTVRILFTNAGVLIARNDIKHPKNRVPTLPTGDDDSKTAKRLLRKLLGHVPVNPPLLCNVEVVATG